MMPRRLVESVRLKVMDAYGRKVAVRVHDHRAAGSYATSFDGASFASGTFFSRLIADGVVQMSRVVLLK
jgi:hypothetical protein